MRRVFNHWLFWYVVGFLLVAVVLVASLVPTRDLPSVSVNDKIEHFGAYAALALWFGGLTEPRNYYRLSLWLLVMGGGIEIAQGAMNIGRQAEWNDFFADGAGVVAGLALCLMGLRHWASWIEHWTRER
jgi:VanZ family protein